jgi:hypothetical protein
VTKWVICIEDLPKMLPTKFWFIWQSSFRGEDFFKSANQKQELPWQPCLLMDRSGQNEQYLERTFHRNFLPSFTSFGWGVSEEKIKMWKVNGRHTTDDKWWQKLTLPLARWAKNVLGLFNFTNIHQLTLFVSHIQGFHSWTNESVVILLVFVF